MPAHLRIARSKGPTNYPEALAEAVAKLNHAKAVLAAAEEMKEARENDVMIVLAAAGNKTSTVPVDDMRFKVSVVQSETMSFNEPSLRKALSAPVFDKLCDLKLNRNKLEEAIAEGRVDPVVVATYTTVVPRKPYVRLTAIKGSET